jgi:hypothetical protein
MTLRDTIGKRARLLTLAAFGSWVLAAAGMVLSGNGPLSLIFFLPGFVGFLVSIVALILFVRCPRCRFNFGPLSMQLGSLPFGSSARLVNFCPHCGVSLDESLS